jgi:hypothetical protein
MIVKLDQVILILRSFKHMTSLKDAKIKEVICQMITDKGKIEAYLAE